MKLPEFDIPTLDNHLKQDGAAPLLLDLWAPWCGPCKAQAPALEKLSDAAAGKLLVAKIDADAHPGVRERFAVRGIPTLILFKAGQEVSRRNGLQTLDGLRKWMVDEGLALGVTTVQAGGASGEAPFGGAFYGDAELRDFLLSRTLRDAAAGQLQFSRFPFWAQGKGSVMASFARSPDPEIFARVTGLPAAFGFSLEMACFTDAAAIQEAVDRLPTGADVRNVPIRLVQRWLSDSEWNWPDFLGKEADTLRLQWLEACNQLMSGTAPGKERWAAIRELAAKFDRTDPMQTVPDHFATMVSALSPLPDSDEASAWGGALLATGTYLVISRAAYEQGWRALEFAKEIVLLQWFKAHCPDPQTKTREEMTALDRQFRSEHAEMLAIVEPKEKHFRENMAQLMQPFHARLQAHLLAAMAPAVGSA